MNALLIALSACLAMASCAIIQGPGSSAAVLGPDGSQIISNEAGGAVAAAQAIPLAGIPIARALPLGLPVGLGYGIGLGGQYVPSGLENLYDDGSYRVEHHLSELLR